MSYWRGHRPATRKALEAILIRTEGGEREASRAERVLVNAAEFWAATVNRELASHLLRDTMIRLSDAHAAFNELGAESVADILSAVLLDFSGRRLSAAQVRTIAQRIEEEILARDRRLDIMLERAAVALDTAR